MRRYIFIILILVCILSLNCGRPVKEPQPDVGKVSQAEDETVEVTVPSNAELFLYLWGSGDLGAIAPRGGGERQLIVADVASGETIAAYSMDEGKQLLFAPDFSGILVIEEDGGSSSVHIRLTDPLSGDTIWETQKPVTDEVSDTQYRNANWDLERGHIILEGMEYNVRHRTPESGDTSFEMSWWFLTLDLTTGDEIARLDIIDQGVVTFLPAEPQGGAKYSAGRLYIPLPDYPVTNFAAYGRYGESEDFNIYAIDPITGEVEEIDMRGMLGNPINAKFFPATDGSSILVQTQQKSEFGIMPLIGGSVQRIDLETGQWELLFEHTPTQAYSLRGMTPDGSRLLLSRLDAEAGQRPKMTNIVHNLNTGVEIEIPVKGMPNFMWLSASGKYVVSFTWGHGRAIVINDVTSGEERVLEEAKEGWSPFPLKFLGGLGNGI